jgi:hypothetical protein
MPSRKIDTVRGQVIFKKVSDLIDPISGMWDEVLIRDIFNPLEAEKVLEIPLSQNLEDDFVAWHKSKNFIFSVRSAYYSEWEHQYGARVIRRDGQGASTQNPMWDILWKLNVPTKIKIFGWRALHGLILGVGVLASRHIKVSPQCPICLQGCEDICHLLFKCKRAKSVWKALGLQDVISQATRANRSGSIVLEDILQSPRRKSPILGQLGLQETILVAGWYIWWQRREAVKEERVASPISSPFSIQALTVNYGHATGKAVSRDIVWSKPPLGQYKLNVDAAFFPSGGGAVAAVIRDSKGEAIAGGARPFLNIPDATSAEASALR